MGRLKASSLSLLALALLGCGGDPATLEQVITSNRIATPEESQAVRITRRGEVLRSEIGMLLQVGDTLETGATIIVVIGYKETQFILQPDSQIELHDRSILARIGSLFVKTKGSFKVATVYGAAATEGTMFTVAVDDKTAVVAVFDGSLRVEPEAHGTEMIQLLRHEEIVLYKAIPGVTRAPLKRSISTSGFQEVVGQIRQVEVLSGEDAKPQARDSVKDLQQPSR